MREREREAQIYGKITKQTKYMHRGFSSHKYINQELKESESGVDPVCVFFLPPRRVVHEEGEERKDGRSQASNQLTVRHQLN